MTSAFRQALERRNPSSAEGRRFVYVPYDQLTDRIGPLATLPPEQVGIVLIETTWKARRRPYHKQKLALILANMRHFALEQAERGVFVDHRMDTRPYDEVLDDVIQERGSLVCMRPAERELRVQLQRLVDDGRLELVPHEGWLTTAEDFEAACSRPPYRMDAFYRRVRKRTGVLMDGGKPTGGRYSFDGENRERWSGDPIPPAAPTFQVDAITAEVGELIRAHFAHHPGVLHLERLPVTRNHAEGVLGWAVAHCLEHFGPYEDAFTEASRGLFHTRLSPLLNLHRMLPRDVVQGALRADIPLNSKEGLIRQVLGWREFVRHVHEATDGFRDLPDGAPAIRATPGDGGFETWSGTTWSPSAGSDGGAAPSVLGSERGVPPALWGTPSGLRCLDHVVDTLWDDGWTHHIPRLMVLSNLATLLDVSPRDLTDWFWVAYIDAFDWVVEPNVLGMGTFGAGPLMTTKPYVSGAAYLDRMGDSCAQCRFHPKKSCPVTAMYWAFLDRHRQALSGNPRMALPMRSLERRGEDRREADNRVATYVMDTLETGHQVTVDGVERARRGTGSGTT